MRENERMYICIQYYTYMYVYIYTYTSIVFFIASYIVYVCHVCAHRTHRVHRVLFCAERCDRHLKKMTNHVPNFPGREGSFQKKKTASFLLEIDHFQCCFEFYVIFRQRFYNADFIEIPQYFEYHF